jgi:hypothetical protein
MNTEIKQQIVNNMEMAEINRKLDLILKQVADIKSQLSITVVEEKAEIDENNYVSVEDAPLWTIYYKLNTSEGVMNQKIEQKAWTDKQAIFLGRTEQLFKLMSDMVKSKNIQPKWNILEAVATKQ